MTGPEYETAIAKIGLSQSAAGRFLRASPRSSRRWVIDGPPPMVAVILQLMVRGNLTVEYVETLMADDRTPARFAKESDHVGA